MNITLAFYLVDVLNNIQSVMVLSAAIIFIVTVVTLFILVTSGDCDSEEDKGLIKKCIKVCFSLTIACSIVASLIPSQKTMYLMVASEVTKELAANPEITKIGEKLLTIVNGKLDELTKKEGK